MRASISNKDGRVQEISEITQGLKAIAKELGYNVEVRYSNVDSNYNNLISLKVMTDSQTFQLDGSIFDDMKPTSITNLIFYLSTQRYYEICCHNFLI